MNSFSTSAITGLIVAEAAASPVGYQLRCSRLLHFSRQLSTGVTGLGKPKGGRSQAPVLRGGTICAKPFFRGRAACTSWSGRGWGNHALILVPRAAVHTFHQLSEAGAYTSVDQPLVLDGGAGPEITSTSRTKT